MYTCMCNWVPMLYSGKKKFVGGNNNKKIKINTNTNKIKYRKKSLPCQAEKGNSEAFRINRGPEW